MQTVTHRNVKKEVVKHHNEDGIKIYVLLHRTNEMHMWM